MHCWWYAFAQHVRYAGSVCREAARPLKRLTLTLALGIIVASSAWILSAAFGARESVVDDLAAAAFWVLVGSIAIWAVAFVGSFLGAPARLYFDLEQNMREKEHEAKAEVDRLNVALEIAEGMIAAKSKRLFPDIEIELEPFFALDLKEPLEPPRAEIALLFQTRVTNRESSQRVNLTFDMHLIWEVRVLDQPDMESRLSATRQTTNRKYEEELFPAILELDGGRTSKGLLSFNYWSTDPVNDRYITFPEWENDEGSSRFEAGENHHFRITVHDFVSSQTVSLVVPGIWPPREITT